MRVFKNEPDAPPHPCLDSAPGPWRPPPQPGPKTSLVDAGCGGCPIGKMGVELAPVGGREEATGSMRRRPRNPSSILLTFLCKCCSCKRRDWLPLPTDDDDLAPPRRGRRKTRPADRCRFSDQKPGHSVHSTLHEEAKSPLRVGRAGGALKLSPTVELFVYDDEDGPVRDGAGAGGRAATSAGMERGRRRLGAPGRRGGGAHFRAVGRRRGRRSLAFGRPPPPPAGMAFFEAWSSLRGRGPISVKRLRSLASVCSLGPPG